MIDSKLLGGFGNRQTDRQTNIWTTRAAVAAKNEYCAPAGCMRDISARKLKPSKVLFHK